MELIVLYHKNCLAELLVLYCQEIAKKNLVIIPDGDKFRIAKKSDDGLVDALTCDGFVLVERGERGLEEKISTMRRGEGLTDIRG